MTRTISSRRVVLVSFLVDLLDVVTNLIVALITGSAVIFGEMAQGIADSIGSGLLVIGERRAVKPRDARHPLGYGREAFFWGLLSAIAMLIVGAGLSGWRGYQQLVNPQPLAMPQLAVAVLMLAVVSNGYAVSLSARKLAAQSGGLRNIFVSLNRPLIKGALLRDLVGTFTSIVGLCAMLLYQSGGLLLFDALGALAAAVLMAVGSLVLIAQARALITGRALPEALLRQLHTAVLDDPRVRSINRLSAIYAGASEVLIDADLSLAPSLDTRQIEQVLDEMEARARAVVPDTEHVRVLLNPAASGGQSASVNS